MSYYVAVPFQVLKGKSAEGVLGTSNLLKDMSLFAPILTKVQSLDKGKDIKFKDGLREFYF